MMWKMFSRSLCKQVERRVCRGRFSNQPSLPPSSGAFSGICQTALRSSPTYSHTTVRSCSTSSGSRSPDEDLQLTFDSFEERLALAMNFFSADGFAKYQKLVSEGIIPVARGIFPIKQVELYILLQNPLLARYQFDAKEFLLGAKDAFSVVHQTIASREFANYANGYVKSSEGNDLLEATLAPRLYQACLEASRELNKQGVSITMTGLTVSQVMLSHINTEIATAGIKPQGMDVDDNIDDDSDSFVHHPVAMKPAHASTAPISTTTNADVVDGDKVTQNDGSSESENKLAGGSTTTTPNIDSAPGDSTVLLAQTLEPPEPHPDPLHAQTQTQTQGSEYPPGSVVATVDVYFEALEEYTNHVHAHGLADEATQLSEVTSARVTSSYWTFQGVISGQEELEWKIISFR
mmetsp:Transcript_21513/g.36027  ORF Transcript_21513/g.36027 Transcript_21513/m.36027 type:complete len:406 (-) Transcript_21513:332-1549(-)